MCMCVCVSVRVCVCVDVCMYVYMYVCVCVYLRRASVVQARDVLRPRPAPAAGSSRGTRPRIVHEMMLRCVVQTSVQFFYLCT